MVDDDGTLRLVYWDGNDRMKTRPLNVEIPKTASSDRLVMLEPRFDVERGVALEGRFAGLQQPRFLALNQGLYIEFAPGQGAGIMVVPHGSHQFGIMRADRLEFRMDAFINRRMPCGADPRFRLLLRHSLLEFYLNDHLVQCYSLPGRATGKIGIIHNGNPQSIADLKAWN